MLRPSAESSALIGFVQRHERRLIVAWLAFCGALVAVLGVWGIALGGAERAVDAWDHRWVRELDLLEAEVRAGHYTEAAPALERLDREQPAVFVKHRFDRERERLLGLLGECDVKLDHRGRARDALKELVEFDPKNYDNHFRLAEAERAFGDTSAAREEYEKVLAIHPTHWPSVKAMIEMPYAAGNYAPVVETYEHYLDAWLLARVRVACGERSLELDVPVDGREHALEGVLELPADWNGSVRIETVGYSARLASLEFTAPLRAGVAEAPASATLRPDDGWREAGAARLAPNEISAADTSSSLSSPPFALPQGCARIRVELTLFKALPAATWDQVVRSYKNKLEIHRLPAAKERSRIGGCAEAGTVFAD